MGKSKPSKSGNSVPNPHLHSRISFLHQAASYLAEKESAAEEPATFKAPGDDFSVSEAPIRSVKQHYGQTRHLLGQLRGVSRKSQIRLSKDVKRSMCKRCDSLLISEESSLEGLTNASKERGKPWADVYEIKCKTCGTVKRYPVGQPRMQRAKFKKNRSSSKKSKEMETQSKKQRGKEGPLTVNKPGNH